MFYLSIQVKTNQNLHFSTCRSTRLSLSLPDKVQNSCCAMSSSVASVWERSKWHYHSRPKCGGTRRGVSPDLRNNENGSTLVIVCVQQQSGWLLVHADNPLSVGLVSNNAITMTKVSPGCLTAAFTDQQYQRWPTLESVLKCWRFCVFSQTSALLHLI